MDYFSEDRLYPALSACTAKKQGELCSALFFFKHFFILFFILFSIIQFQINKFGSRSSDDIVPLIALLYFLGFNLVFAG